MSLSRALCAATLGSILVGPAPEDPAESQSLRSDRLPLGTRWGAVPPAAETPPAPATFASSVRPVLARRCTPCHEPGGKMYDRLPFDDAKVIRDHREGVLRRLKGDDHAVVEAWIDAKAQR